MRKTLKEIAQIIEGELVGEANTVITGVCGIEDAGEGDITFVANPRYLPLMAVTRASAIITSFDIKSAAKPIIRTANPSLAFAKALSLVMPEEIKHPKGIHPTAILGKNVKLGNNVAIGAHAVVEDDCSIADNAIIYPGCFIGQGTTIGSDTLIYANVSIREHVQIGKNVIIHSGTVVGSDGFGFATVNGVHHKIPQVGTVEIGDDVEIGANVAIDRARFAKTVIGRGTKIDNLVQIAHNVVIGENCLIVSQVGISGSTVLGNNVVLAGQVGLVGHIKVGDGAVVAAQSGVSKSIPDGTMMWGYPAKPIAEAKKVNACVQRLPELYKTIAELKKRIQELEGQLKLKK
jgi:UDP-3-O-[3-hydroxymyristoyl] glucosamine N-acyltransferase